MNICSCSLAGTKACWTCPSNTWSKKHEDLFWGGQKVTIELKQEEIELQDNDILVLPSGTKYKIENGELVEYV